MVVSKFILEDVEQPGWYFEHLITFASGLCVAEVVQHPKQANHFASREEAEQSEAFKKHGPWNVVEDK